MFVPDPGIQNNNNKSERHRLCPQGTYCLRVEVDVTEDEQSNTFKWWFEGLLTTWLCIIPIAYGIKSKGFLRLFKLQIIEMNSF